MERDNQKKRSRAVEGGSSGRQQKKERERKGKGKGKEKDVEIEPAVVVVEDEVEEFYAILRRMQQAVKYYDKAKAVAMLPDPVPEVDNAKDSVKKTTDDVVLLDLNSLPDDDGE